MLLSNSCLVFPAVVKQQQEEIYHNHVQTLFAISVFALLAMKQAETTEAKLTADVLPSGRILLIQHHYSSCTYAWGKETRASPASPPAFHFAPFSPPLPPSFACLCLPTFAFSESLCSLPMYQRWGSQSLNAE